MQSTGSGRDPLQVLGATIRRLRKAKRLTQSQLGALAETHGNYIGLIERGERNISALNLCYVASALGVVPADLWREVTKTDLPHLPAKSSRRLRRDAPPARTESKRERRPTR